MPAAALTNFRTALRPRFVAAMQTARAFGVPALRFRIALYGAVVIAVSGWLCLHRLGAGTLVFDEAWFAVSTEHMLRTGDYIVPTIGEPHGSVVDSPHLNAAPLYNWLCCLTADVIGDGALRYRLWSGLFGIGCALAALVLAAMLFGAEAGLVAGLVVGTNLNFLFIQGIREGRMDPALAFFVTVAVIGAVRAQRAAGLGGGWWALAGASIGCAALIKPPVMAGFFFFALSAHHVAVRRDLPWRRRLVGPLVAAAVAALVALPWYAALYVRLGWPGVEAVAITTSIGRAAKPYGGNSEPWWFYLDWVWKSSLAFKLVGPALAWGLVSAVSGTQRFAWGLLGFLSLSFLAAISISATRHWQYVYPIYPVLAVAVAGFLCTGLRPLPETGWSRWLWRIVAVVGVIGAAYGIRHDYRIVNIWVRHMPLLEYPPLMLHTAAERDLATGKARLVLYRFPVPEERLTYDLGFSPTERLYPIYWMPHAVRAKNEAELDRLIADGVPTVVFLPPHIPDGRMPGPKLSRQPDARLDVASRVHPFPVLAFNGAETAMKLREVLATQVIPPK